MFEEQVSKFNLLPAFKKSVKADIEFQSKLEDYESRFEAAKSSRNYPVLMEIQYGIGNEIKSLEWPIAYLEAMLKVECGLGGGIEGVASWVREVVPKPEIDEGRLFVEDRELYNNPAHFSQGKPYKRALRSYRKD
jgi:hypothetical protein